MTDSKRLTIRYGDTVLFDGDVTGISWDDSPTQVKVVGKLGDQPSLAQLLAARRNGR